MRRPSRSSTASGRRWRKNLGSGRRLLRRIADAIIVRAIFVSAIFVRAHPLVTSALEHRQSRVLREGFIVRGKFTHHERRSAVRPYQAHKAALGTEACAWCGAGILVLPGIALHVLLVRGSLPDAQTIVNSSPIWLTDHRSDPVEVRTCCGFHRKNRFTESENKFYRK
jgi:hypothetical protein